MLRPYIPEIFINKNIYQPFVECNLLYMSKLYRNIHGCDGVLNRPKKCSKNRKKETTCGTKSDILETLNKFKLGLI